MNDSDLKNKLKQASERLTTSRKRMFGGNSPNAKGHGGGLCDNKRGGTS